MLFVKDMPCCACGAAAPSEADHAGVRPMGRKCHNFEIIPLCKLHHDQRPGRRGFFADLGDRFAMREWLDAQIARVQSLALLSSRVSSEDKLELMLYQTRSRRMEDS